MGRMNSNYHYWGFVVVQGEGVEPSAALSACDRLYH